MTNKIKNGSDAGYGLPSNIKKWEKLKKFAHSVWNVIVDGEGIAITKNDSRNVNITDADVRKVNEYVTVYLGGNSYYGKVIAATDGMVGVKTFDGSVVVHQNFTVKAKYAQVPADQLNVGDIFMYGAATDRFKVTDKTPSEIKAVDLYGSPLVLPLKAVVTMVI